VQEAIQRSAQKSEKGTVPHENFSSTNFYKNGVLEKTSRYQAMLKTRLQKHVVAVHVSLLLTVHLSRSIRGTQVQTDSVAPHLGHVCEKSAFVAHAHVSKHPLEVRVDKAHVVGLLAGREKGV
jgi:hypothetical protein